MSKPWECAEPPHCPSAAMIEALEGAGRDVQYIRDEIAQIPDDAQRCLFELGLAREFAESSQHLPPAFLRAWMEEVGDNLARAIN